MTNVTDGPLVVLGVECACEGDLYGRCTWRGPRGPLVVRVAHETAGISVWTVYVHGPGPVGIVARGTGDTMEKAESGAMASVCGLIDALLALIDRPLCFESCCMPTSREASE
jgi:hypothetical protein